MKRDALLILTSDHDSPRRFPLTGEIWVGRDAECQIRLPDRSISRRHALIRKSGDAFELEKKSPFAPLKLNGVDCEHAILAEGDRVQLGPYSLEVIFESVGATSPAGIAHQRSGIEPVERPLIAETQVQDVVFESSVILDAKNLAESEPDPEGAAELEVGSDSNPSPELDQVGIEVSASSFDSVSDDRTKFVPSGQVTAILVFKSGDANHEELKIEKDEISIGRSLNCDVVLSDKKASRKNTIIRRSGIHYTIQDLDSSNGTFLNGKAIKDAELTSGDQIQVGDSAFQFKIINHEYESQESNFPQIPSEEQEEVPQISGEFQPDQVFQLNSSEPSPENAQQGSVSPGNQENVVDLGGVVGLNAQASKKVTLEQRFRGLPRRTQIMVLIAAGLFLWWFMDDSDDKPQKKSPAPQANVAKLKPSGVPVDLGFERLPLEQRNFIESQHTVAFDYYKNRDFDKALFEIEKIFNLVSDYKDSREIERYAKEGKRKLQAIDEEKRKKEEEQQLKIRISTLVDETKKKMDLKQYDEARELFTQILAIDPDNGSVAGWRKDLDDLEEQRKVKLQLEQVRKEINAEGLRVYRQGIVELNDKKYWASIRTLGKIKEIGVSDQKIIQQAKGKIQEIHKLIQRLRDPIFAEAKSAENAGDFAKAFHLFNDTTRIDPRFRAGFEGMSRVRGILHDRAKITYTEAVIAESYSDFESAENLFKKCQEIAPADDIYHERSTRKLAKFASLRANSTIPDSSTGGEPSVRNPSAVDGSQAVPTPPTAVTGQPIIDQPPTEGQKPE